MQTQQQYNNNDSKSSSKFSLSVSQISKIYNEKTWLINDVLSMSAPDLVWMLNIDFLFIILPNWEELRKNKYY